MITKTLYCGNLNGRHLALRAPDAQKDARTGLPWITDPELAKMFMMDWKPSLEKYTELLSNAASATNKYSWMIYLGDEHVGIAAIRGLDNPAIKIGEPSIIINPAYHRQGIATLAMQRIIAFAFGYGNDSPLHYLHVTIRCDNEPSLRLFKKLGFVPWHGSPTLHHVHQNTEPCEVWQGLRAKIT